MKALLDFLFGRSPKIFDKDGQVRHDHPKSKWEQWNNRYQLGSEYNWRNHVGMKAGGETPQKKN